MHQDQFGSFSMCFFFLSGELVLFEGFCEGMCMCVFRITSSDTSLSCSIDQISRRSNKCSWDLSPCLNASPCRS